MPNPEQSVAILALLVSLASLAYAFSKGQYDQLTSVRPALIFVYEHGTGWMVHNVGNGPAMNIVVAQRERGAAEDGAGWAAPVRIPPLKRDGYFPLHWTAHTNLHALGATYQDMWGRPYTSICARDLNRITRGYRLRQWDESDIVAEWKFSRG